MQSCASFAGDAIFSRRTTEWRQARGELAASRAGISAAPQVAGGKSYQVSFSASCSVRGPGPGKGLPPLGIS